MPDIICVTLKVSAEMFARFIIGSRLIIIIKKSNKEDTKPGFAEKTILKIRDYRSSRDLSLVLSIYIRMYVRTKKRETLRPFVVHGGGYFYGLFIKAALYDSELSEARI